MRILLLLPHYLPGTAYGGPVRTAANLVARLGGEYEFLVLSRNRDFGAEQPYALPADRWLPGEGAECFYASPGSLGAAALAERIRERAPRLVCLSSFFHPGFSLLPQRLWQAGRLGDCGLALAPRGELAAAALARKSLRKRAWLQVHRALGWRRGPLWQAASEHEAADIRRVLGPRVEIALAPNLAAPLPPVPARLEPKRPGRLRLLFLARMQAMKNPLFLIERLAALRVEGEIELSLHGPLEDEALWRRCAQAAAALPERIRVHHGGPAQPGELPALFAAHDLLAAPSLGENFGHSILEALCHGLPVIASDRTPWRGLEARRAGFDLPLEQPVLFEQALGRFLALDESGWQEWSRGARALGAAAAEDPEALAANRELLERAARRRPGTRP
jgi:glycosyltransferase involved in cell wall biosynthesis